MIPIELYYGIVEDNNDPERKNKLKIRLFPEMKDARNDHLPWLKPFNGGTGLNNEVFEKEVFERGSAVWCFFDSKTFRSGWYFSGVFHEKRFDFNLIQNELNNINEESLGDYHDLKFSRYKNGTIVFNNISTGFMGVYHSSGSYIIFSGQGDIIAYSKKDIKMYNDNNEIVIKEHGGITVDSGTGNIEFNGNTKSLVKFEDLKMVIDFLVANLDSRMHNTPYGPTLGLMPPFIHTTFNPMHNEQLNAAEADDLKTKN